MLWGLSVPKASARAFVVALALFCAALANQLELNNYRATVVEQIASHDRNSEIITLQQAPFARPTPRQSYGLRGKDPGQSKQDACLTARSAVPCAGTRISSFMLRVPQIPGGYVLVRTQNPRAPPSFEILQQQRAA